MTAKAKTDSSTSLRNDKQKRLVGGGGGFAGFYFFEEPDDADTEEAEEGEPAEDVDEGPVGGLALELLIEAGLGWGGGVGFAEVASEESSQVAEAVLVLLAGEGDGVDDQVLVDGAAAVRSVWAMEMPMEPPTLRMRLKRPLALPICLLSSVP
jgi:hypothetical protein